MIEILKARRYVTGQIEAEAHLLVGGRARDHKRGHACKSQQQQADENQMGTPIAHPGRNRLAIVGRNWLLRMGQFRFRIGLWLAGDGGYGATVEPDDRVGGEFDLEHVILDRADDRVQAAGGDDLVTGAELVLHRHLRLRTAPLRPDQQQPHEPEQRDQHQDVAHSYTSAAA